MCPTLKFDLSTQMVLKELNKFRRNIAIDLYEQGKIRKKEAFKLSGLTFHKFLQVCKDHKIIEAIPELVLNRQSELLQDFDLSPYLKNFP